MADYASVNGILAANIASINGTAVASVASFNGSTKPAAGGGAVTFESWDTDFLNVDDASNDYNFTIDWTKPGSSNLCVFAFFNSQGGSPRVINGITFGGNAMTEVHQQNVDGGDAATTGLFLLKDASVPATNASLAVVVDNNGNNVGATLIVGCFSGVDQTTPTSDVQNDSATDQATGATLSTTHTGYSGELILAGAALSDAANNHLWAASANINASTTESNTDASDFSHTILGYDESAGSPQTTTYTKFGSSNADSLNMISCIVNAA